MISAPESPSTSEWWIFVSRATRSFWSPWIRYASQSGRARSSGRSTMRATCSASFASVPGAGRASSRTWNARSKCGSSIQYG